MVKDTSSLKLNKEQQDAIKFGNGPLLIIAGAGTGKTTVITERIKYLIFSKKAKPEEILALTFTDKAAKEMEERVDVAMPYGYTQMWIMTFHSFCDRILRRDALHIGLDPKYKLMTEAEAVQLLRNNLFKLDLNYFRPLGNPTKFLSGMLQHFSRLQDEDVAPNDYVNWVKKQKAVVPEEKIEVEKWRELSKAYKAYDEIKVKESVLDFGDVIVKTLKLFRDRPNILKEYQNKFKEYIEDDLDTPRVLALLWDVAKDENMSAPDKKATILDFDKVLGLGFENLKEEITELRVETRVLDSKLDKLQNTLDGFVGTVDDLRTDNTVGTHHTRELQIKVNDHEKRLKQIESSKHAI